MARPIWCRSLLQVDRSAAARTFCTAGNSKATRMLMMAKTTRSSISVKASRRRARGRSLASMDDLSAAEDNAQGIPPSADPEEIQFCQGFITREYLRTDEK